MPKLTAWKAEDDYYGAHGGFLLKEKTGRSWAGRHTSNISLGWSENKCWLVIARSGATKQSWWGGSKIATHLSGARNDS